MAGPPNLYEGLPGTATCLPPPLSRHSGNLRINTFPVNEVDLQYFMLILCI